MGGPAAGGGRAGGGAGGGGAGGGEALVKDYKGIDTIQAKDLSSATRKHLGLAKTDRIIDAKTNVKGELTSINVLKADGRQLRYSLSRSDQMGTSFPKGTPLPKWGVNRAAANAIKKGLTKVKSFD